MAETLTSAQRRALGELVQANTHRPAGDRRHPAEVTADRLLEHLEKWFDTTDGELRDEISHVRHWLYERAENAR